ncbi:LexA family transcriptional regulator [Cobetia amphilecti]|uniref:LexA family transcriptional regulator n=1 Tax=Cobetia amphilecti TaxID=1055104 RepID=UPI00244ABC44|nr:helix-turn-helix transcriptional regulator [Cobetia litoralis]MDH2420628.1 helix-turn-helix transcriptional regulator [Cobetia litoralis]
MFAFKYVPLVHDRHVLKVKASPIIIGPMVHTLSERDEFASRLKKALAEQGIPDRGQGVHLKNLTGVTPKAASKWLNAESMPGQSKLVLIAKGLNVRAEWLRFGTGPMRENSKNELVFHEAEFVDGDAPLREDEVEIPYFREVEMAAGDGRTQVIENHGAYMRFSLLRLARAGVDPEQAACATVTGNSMEPAIIDGSPIGIDKSCRHIIDGKIYALDHGGMLRVKRLYRLPLNRMRVVSDNHIEYPEEVYTLGDPDAPKIIGRVFWWEVFA